MEILLILTSVPILFEIVLELLFYIRYNGEYLRLMYRVFNDIIIQAKTVENNKNNNLSILSVLGKKY